MEQIERIKEMERIMNRHEEVLKKFNETLKDFKESQSDYNRLVDYYSSSDYLKDYDWSNEPDFPKDIKCGVLSEDGIYNIIGDNYSTAIEMMETALEIIKRH
ncbi:DUF4298 domain-containing protein [Lagierella sp.]|uniref:DUF4298 domain-containing protein n=1 Tax=Lagierella sp. TaxID=2849657 RepID=UPI002639D1CC|nr:DUF4298 domain-containing protein [Lagierella sp.]